MGAVVGGGGAVVGAAAVEGDVAAGVPGAGPPSSPHAAMSNTNATPANRLPTDTPLGPARHERQRVRRARSRIGHATRSVFERTMGPPAHRWPPLGVVGRKNQAAENRCVLEELDALRGTDRGIGFLPERMA